MNKIVNKPFFGQKQTVPKLNLRQPGFTYSALGPFAKHRERIQNFREIGNLKHLCKNLVSKLSKVCFAHDAAYSNSKDQKLKSYEIVRKPKYNGYQKSISSFVYNILDKKTRSAAKANASKELS